MRTSSRILLFAAVGMTACALDHHPAAPEPQPSTSTTSTAAEAKATTAADHAPGASVSLSPLGYVAFTRAGADANSFAFTARLADSTGASLTIPTAGLDWSLAPGATFRIDADSVAEDRQSARLVVSPTASGRDAVIASHGAAADTAFAENWEWMAPAFKWEGDPWTPAGESRCAQVTQTGASGTTSAPPIDLTNFDLYAASFDSDALQVDSASVAADRRSVRLCFTGRTSGATGLAMAGRDAANHRFWGWHRDHVVLTPPLSLDFAHGARYEIGIGQRTELDLRLRDGHGASVLLGADSGTVSWTSASPAVATISATGAAAGVASGSSRVSAAYRDLTAQATVAVYEITGGMVSNENICISTKRGTVRCWGNSNEYHPMLGYAVAGRNLGIVRPVQVADVDVGGTVRDFFQGSSYAACAITTDTRLRCWGSPNWGAFGYGHDRWIGDNEHPSSAGPVPLGGTPAYVGGGIADHFCTVLTTGGLRCVGSNLAGQVGYGIPHSREEIIGDDETPAQMGDVPLGGKAVQVATGGRAGMTCAALENGRGRCWGINANDWVPATSTVETPTYGLGYGRTVGYNSPIGDDETPADAGDLPLADRIEMFALGGFHICAVMEGGSVRCWGSNYHGQLGAGGSERAHVAHAGDSEELVFPSPVVQIEAAYRHTCVLMENGAVRCWGANYDGALGLGDTRGRGILESAEFVQDVPLGGPAKLLLASGSNENCAVLRAGGLRCWGSNWNGHFGYPFTEDVGDDETPADVGDIMVFPGPVPPTRLGTLRLPAATIGASARVPATSSHAPPGASSAPPEPAPVPSVFVMKVEDQPWWAGARDRPTDWPPTGPLTGPLIGPLVGASGLVAPSAVPASATWIKVEKR